MEILFQGAENLFSFNQFNGHKWIDWFNIIDVHVTSAKYLCYFYSLDLLMLVQSKNVAHP